MLSILRSQENMKSISVCDVLRGLVPFAQFKKREKQPRKSVTFSKFAILLKVAILHGSFSQFLKLQLP